MMNEEVSKSGRITPQNRRAIIYALSTISLVAIIAEVFLTIIANQTSEALLSIASVGVGALAGAMLPGSDPN